MSGLSFKCPKCEEPLEVEAEQAGKEGRCPNCSEKMIIPPEKNENFADQNNKTEQIESKEVHQTVISADTPLDKGKVQAKAIISDFKSMDLKGEILPFTSENLQNVLKDFVFWAITLLGTVPLLIVTVANTKVQLTMFALFFAFVWGVIFKYFILRNSGGWKWPLASLFFTGIIGISLLLAFYRHVLPEKFTEFAASDNLLFGLLGLFFYAFSEELLKALPILLFYIIKRKKVNPEDVVILAVFSGLGFAAFENLQYGVRSVISSFELTANHGIDGLELGVQSAMLVTMLRSVSLVFCHAIWSGVVGYFVSISLIRKKKIIALIILGICVSSILHGTYNWFSGLQPTIAALIAGFSFTLFYGYLSKLRIALSKQEDHIKAV